MAYIIVFLLGLAVGSFLNVCIYRIPRHESIVFGPSHCPSCGKKLNWYDMVPVLSYMFLRGRCRFCSSRISFRYPAVEFLNGITWLILYAIFGFSLYFFAGCIAFSVALVLLFKKKDNISQ